MTRRAIQMIVLGVLLLAAALVLAACQSTSPTTPPPPPAPTSAPAPTQPPAAPTPTPAPTKPALTVPFQDLWAASGHGDTKAAAFNYWNTAAAGATPAVPGSCATCHSSGGLAEFITTGKTPKDQPIGGTVTCSTCHNDATLSLTSVTFTSGVTISNLGPEARCMVCHQGRAAQKTVDDQIKKFAVTDVDAVVAPLQNADGTSTKFSFINAHYFTAALSLYGADVNGGYQYPGQAYDPKNQHVPQANTCVACHNPHSLEVRINVCAECHTGVKAVADLQNIREPSSVNDFNGNGDTKEGIAKEVAGVQANLLKGIQAYAKEVAGVGIVYDGATYPYFLQDKDGDGKADVDAKGATVSYPNWTARLLKAAFNYQIVSKDPGAFAHNPKYVIELMYDSLTDLNTKLTTKVDMSKMVREDVGHFAGSNMAFRDWDDAGQVPYGCAKCHSSTGLPQFIANGGKFSISKTGTLDISGISSQPVANGFQCTTCHDGAKFPNILAVVNVPFPNGSTLTFSTKKDDKGNLLPVNANICIECHQGRQSTVTMNNYLASFKELDKADPKITFKNVHYFAAGATLFGSDAQGIYQYTGKTYVGRNTHVDNFQTCTDCHDKHTLAVKAETCASCHKVTDPTQIRMSKEDYDGSKDAAEPMSKVVENFKTRLYAAIQKYAKDKNLPGLVYDPSSNPYFFLDKNGDGKADVDDKGAKTSYNSWTPRLLEAGYNYQYSVKDPGAFAHNPKYVLQALYDSIQDLGGDLTGLVRPQ